MKRMVVVWTLLILLVAGASHSGARAAASATERGSTRPVLAGGLPSGMSVREVAKLIASDPDANDFFGTAVAVAGDTMVVGAHRDDGDGDNAGAAYLFERNAGGSNNWGFVKKITDGVVQAGDQAGISVAIDGDTIVVGARNASANSGAAYVFDRDEGGPENWGLVGTLTADDGQASDRFGIAVAVSGDTVVVGADGEDGAGDSVDSAGAAYVFGRHVGGPDTWGQIRKLAAYDPVSYGYFGASVALDGDTAVVGSEGANGGSDGTLPDAGAAYVFAADQGGPGNWGLMTKISATDGQDGDAYGISVAIDGDFIVVGAYDEDGGDGDPHNDAGAAYVHARDEGGSDSWGQVARLMAGDPDEGDEFGKFVAISGTTVIVGAHYEDDGPTDPLEYAGAAYVFGRDQGGPGNWGQQAKFDSADLQVGDSFGYWLALDGIDVIVGAPDEDGGSGDPINGSGAAYVFCLDDGLEPNDSLATAIPVGSGGLTGLRVCGGDDDYYGLTATAGQTIDVSISFSHAAGDIDMGLLDASGNLLASSTSTTDTEMISYLAPAAGDYYIRVYGYLGAQNSYDMLVVSPCDDDGLEDNDNPGQATPLPPYAVSGLQICSGDADYFLLDLAAGDTMTATIAFTHAIGDLDMTLLDPGLVQVGQSYSTTDDEQIVYQATAAGTHYVHVYGFAGAVNTYDLSVSVTPAEKRAYLPFILSR